MRRLAFAPPFALASLLGCNEPPSTPMSYAPCTASATCGISTRCDFIRVTTTGAPAALCTAPCVEDLECPGWAGRCVAGAAVDGGAPRCLHGCASDADCRPGTRCLPVRDGGAAADGGLDGVCAPDLGPRPCERDSDCAPFLLRCAGADGGASELRCR